MKKLIVTLFSSALPFFYSAQIGMGDTTINSADRLINSNSRLTIGGYGQFDFNQEIEKGTKHNGVMDIHRMVFLTGYKFSNSVSFVTELEVEHVKEVYVEQAFVNWRINPYINFRGGLMLIPMGIINEYHEPVTFNGVERPNLDKYIIPTTWREIGAGFSGTIPEIDLRYQAYVVNGFSSYDGTAKLSGKSGLRGGRQKGAKSTFTNPNFAFKTEYYGINKLKIGVSGYFGKTQSSMFNGLDLSNENQVTSADSSVLGIAMFSLDARYKYKGFEARGQYVFGSLTNTIAYNTKFGKDLGSEMQGYFIEAGYDFFRLFKKIESQRLVAFARYENYNTHHKVKTESIKEESYNRTDMTFGLSFHLTNGVVFKGDYQIFTNNATSSKAKNQLNFGIGVWF